MHFFLPNMFMGRTLWTDCIFNLYLPKELVFSDDTLISLKRRVKSYIGLLRLKKKKNQLWHMHLHKSSRITFKSIYALFMLYISIQIQWI